MPSPPGFDPGTTATIRVAIELGYDGGRVGAWPIELPGCFVWAPSREVALARVPSAVGAFADWLARHDEPIDVPDTDRVEVVEELDAAVRDERGDSTERNVLLTADRRPARPDEVEATIRRLAFARADLLALAGRVRDWEAANGALPATDAAGRDPLAPDAVLRHVGGAEVWLAGRMDRRARYEGPPRDGDVDVFLDATRAWAIERIRALALTYDGAVHDRAGEAWTLAKVLRRLVYHSLDHLGELDRRLANADGAADRLTYRRDGPVRPEDLTPLFRAVGWYRLVRDPARTARLLEGSTDMVSAWDGLEMVGFARAISDQAAYGLISTVAVHPRWQGRGVARRLITRLLEHNDEIRFSLSAVPGVESLYASVGFVPDERAMVRRRLR